jgi:hypothetical protein
MLGLDFVKHVSRQIVFSKNTFGPARGVFGVIDHLKKEIAEVEASVVEGEQLDDTLEEFIDIVILGLDGAWRLGFSAEQIAMALVKKQIKNEGRSWPDWRKAEPGKAIEHVR